MSGGLLVLVAVCAVSVLLLLGLQLRRQRDLRLLLQTLEEVHGGATGQRFRLRSGNRLMQFV